MLHSNIAEGDMHFIQQWTVADTTARDALSVAAADVGKVCEVGAAGAEKTFYILADDSPMTWTEIGGGGAGDVVGPASATDNAIVRFDSTTGKLIQDSGITIADGASGTLAGTNSGDVTLNASVADIFGLTGQELTGDDPAADRIVFWDDSAGKLTHLTVGSGLTITDTTMTASGGGGGITLGTPQASTSGTSIDFTGIPSGTKQIVINFIDVSTNGSAFLTVQIGDSGGIETTGYVTGAGYLAASNSNDYASSYTAGFATDGGASASWGSGVVLSGSMRLFLENSTSNTWVYSFTGVTAAVKVFGDGYKTLSAELDRVRITTTNGTDAFDAGEINIQYQS